MRVLAFLLALFITSCTSVTYTNKEYNSEVVSDSYKLPKPAAYVAAPKAYPAPVATAPNMQSDVIEGSGYITNQTKDDIDQQLFNVSMVFTIPVTANINDEVNAEFIIDPKKTEEEIKNLVKDTTGQVITDSIDVSRTVTAKIVAPNFKVSPSEDVRQALSTTQPTKWSWILTPTAEGDQTVQLRVVAHIMIEGERVERELETFNRNLTIVVTPQQKFNDFVNSHLEWIVGSLIIPLLLWLFSYIKSRKK